MFRCRQRMQKCVSSAVISREFVKNDKTGYMEERYVDELSKRLPPAENFDLTTMVGAGVNLQRVNTVLIDSRPRDAEALFASADGGSEPENQTQSQEVTDEQ